VTDGSSSESDRESHKKVVRKREMKKKIEQSEAKKLPPRSSGAKKRS